MMSWCKVKAANIPLTEVTCPVVEECSYIAVGLGTAGGVVVGILFGVVGTISVMLVVMGKKTVNKAKGL